MPPKNWLAELLVHCIVLHTSAVEAHLAFFKGQREVGRLLGCFLEPKNVYFAIKGHNSLALHPNNLSSTASSPSQSVFSPLQSLTGIVAVSVPGFEIFHFASGTLVARPPPASCQAPHYTRSSHPTAKRPGLALHF